MKASPHNLGEKMKCYTCESLKAKLENAKSKNDVQETNIAYNQMREHLTRVKYPGKHGFKKR